MTTTVLAQTLLDSDVAVADWTLDPGRTEVRIKHKTFWGLGTVTGVFSEVSGSGTVSADHGITGTITVGAASVDTKNAKRDTHLRSSDFFDVQAHPNFVVSVRSATLSADGQQLKLAAELTIKGVSQPLTLTADVTELNESTLAVHVTGIVDRQRFGITGNQLGMIKDESVLDIDAVFDRVSV